MQSSQIPGWSSLWVKQVEKKKKIFLHEKLSTPLTTKIMPEDSAFAMNETDQEIVRAVANELENKPAANLYIITDNKGSNEEDKLYGENKKTQYKTNKLIGIKLNINEDEPDSKDSDRRKCVEILKTKQQFRPWVKYCSILILCAGFLPEFV